MEVKRHLLVCLGNTIVTQTSGEKYLFVQQEETCAQGKGRNQFYNGNWFRIEAAEQRAGTQRPVEQLAPTQRTWKPPPILSSPDTQLPSQQYTIRTFPATNLPIFKWYLEGGMEAKAQVDKLLRQAVPFKRTLTSCLPLNLWVYEFVN